MQLLLPTGVILNSDNDMVIQQHLNHGAVEYKAIHKAVENETETIQEEVKPKRGRKSTKTET